MTLLRPLTVRLFFFLFVTALLFFTASAALGDILRVKADGEDYSADCPGGESWETAFRTIQKAIDCASPGDEIWVKAGTYLTSTINVSSPVLIYGGFAGNETQRDQRNWESNITTIDGQGVRCFYVTANATIDGVTITGGRASVGGAIYNDSGSTATIANCTFSDNYTFNSAGAIYNFKSSGTITNCTFTGNTGDGGHGGAILNEQSSPLISHCEFNYNIADNAGGAIGNSESSPTIENCSFFHNFTLGGAGGAIINLRGSSPTITNCIFSENSAHALGGAISNEIGSSPVISNCIFYKNRVKNDNDDDDGSAIGNSDSSPIITNCTFYNNYIDREGTPIAGSQIYNETSSPTITNSIVWDDNTPEEPEIHNDSNSFPLVTYSNIRGGYLGEGNIDSDPLFVDADSADFHLQANSPCIDAGTNSAPELPTSDFEGGPRILDGDNDGTATVDMGADEAFISSSGHNLGIGVSSGGKMTDCQSVAPESIPDNTNRPDDLIYDLIEMKIEADEPGATVVVTIDLPNAAPIDYRWYKYSSIEGWIDFSREVISDGLGEGAEVNADRTQVTLYITDNGPYDDDPRDGFIEDPSGLGSSSSTSTSSGGGGGGGGGCFIDTAAYGFRRVK